MSDLRATRSDLLGALIAGLVVVAFCVLLLWHDPLVFWNDDYELSVLPVFADVARSWSEGHLPLLSPYSWVCSNLAGEFQYGTFSIFINAAVVLIWKFPLTFPQQAAALSITHLFVLAMGAFLLTRGRKLSIPLSIFVALIAALNGWLICWGASDWFGALGAFAWLPWAWWGLEKSVEAAVPSGISNQMPPGTAAATAAQSDHAPAINRKRLMMAALWPAPFVYLVVTGGFPYTVLMLVLLIAWLSAKSMRDQRQSGSDPQRSPIWGGPLRPDCRGTEAPPTFGDTKVPPIFQVVPMLLGATLGFGLSAPAWLAIFDYIHGSAREMQPASAHWQWIVPWRSLPGLILPCWTVNWANFSTRYLPHTATELACGLVAPAALISAFITRGRQLVRQIKWELILLLLVLLLSTLPMFGVFRWSFRWLPFVHLVLAICGAEALRQMPWPATAATTSLVLVIVGAIAMSIFHVGGTYAFPLTWIFLGLAAIWIVSDLFLPNKQVRNWTPASITFAALLATYLCIPPNCGVPKYNFSQELTTPEPLDQKRLYLAVYSPAEFAYRREYRSGPVGQVARPGNTPMWAQLHFINGYSPILTAGVAREFRFFIHGEIDGDVGKYLVENQSGPGGILEELGVDGIVIAREIAVEPPTAEWRLEFSNDDGRVFHREGKPLARVRSINWIDSLPEKEFATAAISAIDDSRNHVAADVDVPSGEQAALLTFSRPYFRGYDSRLGGQKLAVESYRGLFPIVEVPAGSHGRLTLTYWPWWLILGGAVAGASGVVWGLGLLAALRSFISARP
jgi:hypothetical protein